MKRKFNFGVRVFIYHSNLNDRVKVTVPPFIANKIEWYDDEKIPIELAIKYGMTFVKLSKVKSTYRFGVFSGTIIAFDL